MLDIAEERYEYAKKLKHTIQELQKVQIKKTKCFLFSFLFKSGQNGENINLFQSFCITKINTTHQGVLF